MITQAQIKEYAFKGKRHPSYEETVAISEHLRFHIDGFKYDPLTFHEGIDLIFDRLIAFRRPSEPEVTLDYRKRIYVSITKEPMFKVISSLKKIVKSEDWKIDYSQVETPASIPATEQLEQYAEKNFPKYGSVVTWFSTIGLKEMLRDPNGLFVIMPKNVAANEFRRPEIFFVPSKQVYDWTDEHIVYRTDKVVPYKSKDGTIRSDFTIITLDLNTITEWTRTGDSAYTKEVLITHNFGEFPAVKAGGMIKEVVNNWPIYDSFLDPMLPQLDEAAREHSDLQAEVVQHIFSTMWYIETQECNQCAGTGKVSKAGNMTVCGKCKGEKVAPKGPYKDYVIKKQGIGEEQIPTPPAGYVEKQTDIVKLQDERVENHKTSALSSINMEFLAKTPLNQSGKAKEVDRDELNTFVHGVASHLVGIILNPFYRFIVNYRYTIIEKSREKLLPAIPVPERFDLLSPNNLISQIQEAVEGKVDPSIVTELQLDFINKKFKESPTIRKKLRLITNIDPFPGNSNSEVSDMLLSGSIGKDDAVLSIYIESFVNELIEQDKEFLDKPRKEQRIEIEKLSKIKTDALSRANPPDDPETD